MPLNTPENQTDAVKHPALRPVHLALFPVMDNLESVVDLGISQLPITSSTQLVGILMAYHNTMIKLQQDVQNETTA